MRKRTLMKPNAPARRPSLSAYAFSGFADVGQATLPAAAFRGGSALAHQNGSCCCKAETLVHPQRGRLKGGCRQDCLPHVGESRKRVTTQALVAGRKPALP